MDERASEARNVKWMNAVEIILFHALNYHHDYAIVNKFVSIFQILILLINIQEKDALCML